MKGCWTRFIARFRGAATRSVERRATLQLESLEERRLLSVGVTLKNGNLKIIGSNAADVAVVNEVGNKIVVRTLSQGDAKQMQSVVAANRVKSVLFNGKDGNDIFLNITNKVSVALGGAGNDILHGGTNTDVLVGEAGNDVIAGGSGANQILGGAGDDLIFGGANNDAISGDDGRDVIFGREGDDKIQGGAGDDLIFCGVGNDVAGGGAGEDVVDGGAGNDGLLGQEGNDHVFGGDDLDIVAGQYTVYQLTAPQAKGKVSQTPVTSTIRAYQSPLSSFISSPIPSSTSVGTSSGPSTIVYVPDSQYVENSGADLTGAPSVPDAYYGVGLYGNLNGGFFSYPTTPLDPATAGLIYQFNQEKKELLKLNNNAAFTALAQKDLQRQLPFLFG